MAALDQATAKELISFLNEEAVSILACARFYSKLSWAEKATMTTLDLSGFTLIAESLKGRKKEIKLKFDEPLQAPQDIKAAIIRMREEATWVRWPAGMAPFLILAAMALAGLLAFWPEHKSLYFLDPVRDLSMKLFKTQGGVRLAIAIGQAAHTTEALLTLRMGKLLGLRAKWGWAAMAFVMGFPALQEVAVLHAASKMAKGQKKKA